MALFFLSVVCSPSLLKNKQFTLVSRLMSLSRVGTTVIGIRGSAEGVIACSDGENRRGSRSGRTCVSNSSAGRPRHESSIAKNYLKSSSIEKNCLRSSSTWTSGVHRDKQSLPISKVQKPDWYTSARVHDATSEFPQNLVRGLELKGECDESVSIIIHRKCGQDAQFSSGHTSVSCVCRLNVTTWQPFVVNLATKRTSTRCVCRLNAA